MTIMINENDNLKCRHFAFETKKAFQLFCKLVKFQLE